MNVHAWNDEEIRARLKQVQGDRTHKAMARLITELSGHQVSEENWKKYVNRRASSMNARVFMAVVFESGKSADWLRYGTDQKAPSIPVKKLQKTGS